jgi:hypothetical protein
MRIKIESDFSQLEAATRRTVIAADPSSPALLPHELPPPAYVYARRNAWWFLHSYRGCDPAWLKEWESTIPTGRCNCKEGYRKIMESFQWDFSTPEAFFESGVKLHNLVNEKLIGEGDTTKRIVSLEEAYSLWRKPDAGDKNQQA